jgi:hypothetical protein
MVKNRGKLFRFNYRVLEDVLREKEKPDAMHRALEGLYFILIGVLRFPQSIVLLRSLSVSNHSPV